MATTRRVRTAKSDAVTAPRAVSPLELVDFFHRKVVHELIVVEIEPGRFRLEAVIAWRPGRCMLMGAGGPRTWRSLDTLVRHLKTLGTGRTITRLELLT